MKEIGSLLKFLSNAQRKELKKYLEINYVNKKSSKLGKLLDLALEGTETDESARAKLKYKHPKSFSQEKSRLKSIINEFIIVHTMRQQRKLSKNKKTHKDILIDLRINSLLAEIIDKNLKATTIANKIWENNIKIANEIHNTRFELESLIKLFSFALISPKYGNLFNKLLQTKRNYDAEFYVYTYNTYLAHLGNQKLLKETKHYEEIEKGIKFIEKEYSDIKTEYFVNRFQSLKILYYGFIAEKTDESKKAIMEAYQNLINPQVKINRHNIALSSVVINTLIAHLMDFEKAKNIILKTIDYLNKEDVNYYIVKINLLLTLYYLGDINGTKQTINELEELREKNTSISPELYEKVMFIKSAIYLALKKHDKVQETLYKIHTLTKDKEGFNLDSRFLELIATIEQNDYNSFTYRLEAIRKYLSRQNIKREYDKLFFNFLKELEKESLNFNNINLDKYIDNMKPHWNDTPGVYLVPYHLWIKSKKDNNHFYEFLLKYYKNKK